MLPRPLSDLGLRLCGGVQLDSPGRWLKVWQAAYSAILDLSPPEGVWYEAKQLAQVIKDLKFNEKMGRQDLLQLCRNSGQIPG